MSISYNTIIVEHHGAVARIALNRPEKLNPLSAELLDELRAALEAASGDAGVRAVLLTGNGRGFCSGADLSARGIGTPVDLGESLRTRYNPVIAAIQGMEKPVVCAVNGIAAGAGCNLVLGCDIVIAARSASFNEIFARIGLLPDAGGTYFLPRIIGTQRAIAASMLAEPISAEQALAWGLVWQVVDDEALQETALALATRLAHGPTAAYAAIKQAFQASSTNSLAQQLDLEATLQSGLGRSYDFGEGVMAFKEKRQAAFKGR